MIKYNKICRIYKFARNIFDYKTNRMKLCELIIKYEKNVIKYTSSHVISSIIKETEMKLGELITKYDKIYEKCVMR